MEDKTNSGNNVVETTEKPTITKKITKTKAKTPGEKSSHPPTSEMVTAAIKDLKDRKGSSLQAIKKYIASAYKVDGEKLAPFIKRYLKAAVTSGAVVQTKGKGASGSFKLSTGKSSTPPKDKKAAPRPAKKAAVLKKTQSVEKKTVPKKSASIKKPVQAKKAVAEKKAATTKKTAAAKPAIKSKTTTEAKSMSKTKKSAKAPAAKTKTPKPKKAAAPKAAARAAAKK